MTKKITAKTAKETPAKAKKAVAKKAAPKVVATPELTLATVPTPLADIILKDIHVYREPWLGAAMELMQAEFFGERKLPKVRVSCGFPKSTTGKAIGQCWDNDCSKDDTFEIFISPKIADPMRVLDILLHELIHAAVGINVGHKGEFKTMATDFGLTGKMTATVCEQGSALWARLQVILGEIGSYPHSPMDLKKKAKQPNKWVRYMSVTLENYKVIVNEDRVEEFGAPIDPNGEAMVPNA